jgi:ABC-type transporter lipoprotein component MlaA
MRARLLPADGVLDQAFDRYTMMRDAYLQHRTAQLNGGEAARPTAADPEGADESAQAETPDQPQ